jgi:DNA-binding transcriptional LysR family regulator
MSEATGFSDAARRLRLSQPSVHRAARDLEKLAGVPLWLHKGGSIRPSAAARRLARQANLFHAEVSAGLAELAELQGRREGELNIGALPLARSGWLPDALGALLNEWPGVRVRIMDGPYQEQLAALLDGRVDLILGALRDPGPDGVLQEALFEDPLVVLVRAGHPFAAGFNSERDMLSDAQLNGLSWILQPEGTPGRKHFEAFLAARGLPPPARVVQCSSVVAARSLLFGSDHAAVLSRRQVELEIRLGLLKVMGPPLTGSWRRIGIATRRSFRPTWLQARLIERLRDGARRDGG